jgi:hypothetical protein
MARTYRQIFGAATVCLDRRDGIGPHHLAIGKTRKLFEWQGTVHAFFSQRYAIGHARFDPVSLKLRDLRVLDVPVGWGGGAFCVDQDSRGRVTLVFLHRNKHELAVLHGDASGNDIAWRGWQVIARGTRLAAPWVEVDGEGDAWCSVLAREGGFQIARVRRDGGFTTGDLFAAGEAPWYHSCVQMLPIGSGSALAVGFRGAFPNQTELVFKTVSAHLALGPSQTLARCNVNDALTFHFQAVGDPARGRAHIVYLDDGLTVSHAMFDKGAWTVTRNVFADASFAPQIGLDAAGGLTFLTADYDGAVWSAAWLESDGWSKPQQVAGLPKLEISAAFGRTGYGTGGLISAARSSSGRLPFLMGVVEDDKTARAGLYAGVLGADAQNARALRDAPAVTLTGRTLHAELRLTALAVDDGGRGSWVITIPAEGGAALKLAISAQQKTFSATASWHDRHGKVVRDSGAVRVTPRFGSDAIEADVELERGPDGLAPDAAWAEAYDGMWSADAANRAELVDIAPFDFEPAAATALDPASIAKTFRRIV